MHIFYLVFVSDASLRLFTIYFVIELFVASLVRTHRLQYLFMTFLSKTQINDVHVSQNIFLEYKQPFAITYLGVSLMVIYLPLAIFKDWICRILDRNSLKKCYNDSSLLSSSVGLTVPLRVKEMHICQDEAVELIADMDLSDTEQGWPLINTNHDDEFYMLEQSRELNESSMPSSQSHLM